MAFTKIEGPSLGNVIANNLTITGNLTVSGTQVILDIQNLLIEDNIITLNANVTGAPTLNSGIEVNRGTSANVVLRWNETSDRWEFTNDGTTYSNIASISETTNASNLSSGIVPDARLVGAYTNVTAFSLGANVVANTSTVFVGNTIANVVHTATQLSIANSTSTTTLTPTTLTIGSTTLNAISYTGNVTGTASNATNLNSQPASYYTNASNLSTGTLAIARLDANVLLTTSTTGINASALSTGTVPDGRLTGAYTGITSLALGANTVANTSTVFVGDSTANVVHTATQVSVANSTSTATLTPTTLTIGSATLNAISYTGNVTGTASNATNLNSQPGSYYTNASNLDTGIVPFARLTAASISANGVVTTTTQSFAGNKTFNSDVTITGNLTIIGTETTLNVNNVIVTDSLIQLAANNLTSDVLDIGLYGNYNGDGGAHEHSGLFRDASDGIWKLFVGLQDNPTTTINTSGTGYGIGTLRSYLSSGILESGASTLTITANSSVSAAVTVNTLAVTNTATFSANVNVDSGTLFVDSVNNRVGVGNAVPTHALRVQGTASINGAFTTDTTASFGGATNALSTLGVSGATNALGTLGVSGATNALSTLGVSGATNALSTLGVTGAVNALSTLGVTGATTLSSTLSVSGAANALSTLGISGAANALSTLGISGAANALGTLGVTGATTLSSTLSVSGAANALSTLGISGAANALGTLGVTGTFTALALSTHTGNATFSGSRTFFASGSVLDWNAGDVTVTHAADALTFAGATNGYTFSGGNIIGTLQGSVTNAVTFNNAGSGAASGSTYNGSSAITVSHNTIGALSLGGGILTGTVTSATGMTAWSTTTQGTSAGNMHIGVASGTASSGGAITFVARDSGTANTAQAGIYVISDGSFGTKMYLSTTDSYAAGSKTAVSIDHAGIVNFVRARPTYIGNTILDAANYNSYALPLSGGTLSGTLYFTDTATGVYRSGNRLTVRSESTDAVGEFASYGMYLPKTGQTAGLYVESPIEARSGIRLGNGATSGTIAPNAWAGGNGYQGYTLTGGNSRFGFSSTGGVIDVYADGNFYATDSSHLVLHAGNYSSYALPLTGGTLTGDITTYRAGSPTTGVIYLGNSGTRYLYYDGTNYNLNAANLNVNSLLAGSWTGSASYRGIYHSGMTGSEYIIMSGDTDTNTYISARTGSSVYIRGGNNVSTYQIVVSPSARPTAAGFTILDAGNYNSYALPLGGGTVTGLTTFNAQYLTVGNSGLNTGVFINHGSGAGDYGVLRFYQAGVNNQTIHIFSTNWQSGTLASTSTGAINIDGANGVTFGPWNDPAGYISDAGTFRAKASVSSPKVVVLYDNPGDTTSGAPWYGIGGTTTDIFGAGGYQVQVAGYYGVRLRTMAATLDLYQGGAVNINGSTAIHAGNYGSYALPLSGGTVTGSMSTTSTLYAYGQGNTATSAGIAQLNVYSTGGNGAIMAFHRGGSYAVNMGLDSDNVFRIGGWSAAANRLQLDGSGNLTVPGAKSFEIVHPVDPTKKLRYGAIEGPRVDVIHRGTAVVEQGMAEVGLDEAAGLLPGTFAALARDVQCFVTNNESWVRVRGTVSNGILHITAEDATAPAFTVDWLVIGERQDAEILESLVTDETGRLINEYPADNPPWVSPDPAIVLLTAPEVTIATSM